MIQLDGIIFNLQTGGGISVYERRILEYFTKKNQDYLLTLYGQIPDILGNMPPSFFLARPPRFLERVRKAYVHKNAKVFHSTYYRLPERSIPTVLTVHDFISEKFGYGPSASLFKAFKKRAIKQAHKIICVSSATKEDLLELYPEFEEKDIRVIHHGVGNEFFRDPEIKRSHNTVLFVGARRGYKNFRNLALALGDFKHLNLICVGGGPPTAEDLKISQFLGKHRVKFIGNINIDELRQLYNVATFFAYPSVYEGFGIPILEAYACGCPVLLVRNPATSEVGGNAAFFSPNGTATSLRSTISSLLQDEELVQRNVFLGMGIAKRTTWEKSMKHTHDAFIELM